MTMDDKKKTKDSFLELILNSIPSPDTRIYLREITWNPTEEEIATILCNLRLPIVEEIKNLREYAAFVSSEELKNSIKEEVQERELQLKTFRVLDPGYVYVLQWLNEEGRKDFGGVFGEYDTVKEYVAAEIEEYTEFVQTVRDPMLEKLKGFQIEKNKIIEPADVPEEEIFPHAVQKYDIEGVLIHCYDDTLLNMEDLLHRISNCYVHIPHPFKNGDKVRITGSDMTGTVSYDPESVKKLEERYTAGQPNLDWTDASITISFGQNSEGSMDHDHINPMYVEFDSR